jgi:hypothetical protein
MDKRDRIKADPHHVLNGYFSKTGFAFISLNLVERLANTLKMSVRVSVCLCMHISNVFAYLEGTNLYIPT